MRFLTTFFCVLSIIFYFSKPVVAQWEPCGPYGGVVRFLVKSDSAIFAGLGGRDILRSTDNGRHWKSLNFEAGKIFVHQGSTIFKTMYGKPKRSIDNGKTWIQLDTIPEGSFFDYNDLLLTVADTMLFYSTDNGNTWTKQNLSIAKYGLPQLQATEYGLFAAASSKLYRSLDTGKSWVKIDNGLQSVGCNLL